MSGRQIIHFNCCDFVWKRQFYVFNTLYFMFNFELYHSGENIKMALILLLLASDLCVQFVGLSCVNLVARRKNEQTNLATETLKISVTAFPMQHTKVCIELNSCMAFVWQQQWQPLSKLQPKLVNAVHLTSESKSSNFHIIVWPIWAMSVHTIRTHVLFRL